MKTPTIQVRAQRALLLHAQHVSAGRVLEVSALDAQALIESGRAELVDRADLGVIRDAVRADVAAILRREKPTQRLPP